MQRHRDKSQLQRPLKLPSSRISRKNKRLGIVIFSFSFIILWLQERPPKSKLFGHFYDGVAPGECPVTNILPFEVGCPESCAAVRPEKPNGQNSTEDYYRVTMQWYFGQPSLNNITVQEGTFYENGRNYESVSSEFRDAFGSSSDFLESGMQLLTAAQNDSTDQARLKIKPQMSMHLALCYLCCMTQEEAYHARAVMYDFVKYLGSFHVPIAFDSVECFRERGNSVTTIIVVDEASQRRLYKIYLRVVEALKGEGIPVPISRLDQMPFHITLMGLNYGGNVADFKAGHQDIISPILPNVSTTLQDINKRFWRGENSKRSMIDSLFSRFRQWPTGHYPFVISHDPRFSAKPRKHTRTSKIPG